MNYYGYHSDFSRHMTDLAFLKNKTVLVTGGTGSFGGDFINCILKSKLKKLIVFSRDELKQFHMQQRLQDPRLRFFLGDVRDYERLVRAFSGVDIVVHAAALKQVPALEYNPLEAVKTNILGTQNIINAALTGGIKKALFISTDKAVSPINLYGATKMCAEKLWVAANSYRVAADGPPAFSVVRYGNVIGSRGSIVETLLKNGKDDTVPLTHEEMTRFWLTLERAVDLVLHGLKHMRGGEVFIPKVPSMKVIDLIKALAPQSKIKLVGIRPGEKLHEALLAENEIRQTRDTSFCYVVEPRYAPWWRGDHLKRYPTVSETFTYTSETNRQWFSKKDVLALVKKT